MRRNARILITIFIIVAICGTVLGIQNLEIGNFQRGGNTILGLTLGLDLQGGSHLVYKADLEDPVTGEEVMMNDPQYLRAPTIFEKYYMTGAKIALVTAKDKLRTLLGNGLNFNEISGITHCNNSNTF